MSESTSLRDRGRASDPKSVAEAEKKRQAEFAEKNKQSAIKRKIDSWFAEDYKGARKPMKVFEATVGELQEAHEPWENSRDGTSGIRDIGVFPLTDVICYEGTETDEIRINWPDAGKEWSLYSEGAIMVRESGNRLRDVLDLEGKRFLFTGEWMPTYLKNNFWEGTYFYRVSDAGTAPAATESQPLSQESLQALVNACITSEDIGADEKKWTQTKVLKAYQAAEINDSVLEEQIFDNFKILMTQLKANGYIEVEKGVVSLPVAADPDDLPFE